MCIRCIINNIASSAAASNTEHKPASFASVAQHAKEIMDDNTHPLASIRAILEMQRLLPDMEAFINIVLEADDLLTELARSRSSDNVTGKLESLERENARLKSQVSLQYTNGKALGDALTALTASMNIEIPSLDGTDPRATVNVLAEVEKKLGEHIEAVHFWMREITNRYDLNK